MGGTARGRWLLGGLLVAWSGVAWAADVRWIGAGGGYWEDGANWLGGKAPGAADTVVFDPGEGNALSVVSVGKDDAQGFSSFASCRNFRFLSGETTIDVRKNQIYIGAAGAETEFFVAEGATGTISNNLVSGLYSGSKPLLVKRGRGTFVKAGSRWFSGYGICCDAFRVEAGVARLHDSLAISERGATLSNVTVCAGAELDYRAASGALQATATLTLEADATLRLAKTTTAACQVLVGAGRILVEGDDRRAVAVLGRSTDLSDWTGTLQAEGKGFVFGDESNSAAGWPALNPQARILLANGKTLAFRPPADNDSTALANPVDVTGTLSVSGGVLALQNLNLDGSGLREMPTLIVNGALAVSGGRLRIGGYGLYLGRGSSFDVSGPQTVVSGADAAYYGSVRHPTGFRLNENNNKGRLLAVRDGATVYLDGYYTFTNVFTDCTVVQTTGAGVPYKNTGDGLVATKDSPAVAAFDGAVLRYSARTAKTVYSVYATRPELRCQVGAHGLRLQFDSETWTQGGATYRWCFAAPFETQPSVAADGGIRLTGGGFLDVVEPWRISGPFDCQDGVLRIYNKSDRQVEPTAAWTAAVPLFGLGDMRMGTAKFVLVGVPTPATVRLGTGGQFRVNGAATLVLSDEVGSASHSYELGELAFEPGGALFLVSRFVDLGGTVKAAIAPARAPDGRVRAPVFASRAGELDFLTYEEGQGFRPFAAAAESLDAQATVHVRRAKTVVAADTAVAALKVSGVGQVDTAGADSVLSVNAGVTLTVGEGDDPTVVLLQNGSYRSVASIGGAGTLAFAGGKGTVVVSYPANGAHPARISATLAPETALTVLAPQDGEYGHALDLSGRQSYSGGTLVNGALIRPCGDSALGVGEVHLVNGELGGGGLWMGVAGVTIPNAIRAAGWGSRVRIPNTSLTSLGDTARGAITFTANGELSGPVEAVAPLRTSACGEGVRGVLSGVLSGDRVQIWNTTNALGVAEIVFAGANAHTGGTEVVRSVLRLVAGGTIGAGELLLDDGALVFDNGTADLCVANRIRGVGTVRLAGRGLVSLGPVEGQDGTGLSLDVACRTAQVSSLAGFGAVTTSRSGTVTLIVGDDDIAFGGPCPANICLVRRSAWAPPGTLFIVR